MAKYVPSGMSWWRRGLILLALTMGIGMSGMYLGMRLGWPSEVGTLIGMAIALYIGHRLGLTPRHLPPS